MTKKRYAVHTWTICDGWINTWTETIEGKEHPQTFPSIEEARAEITQHIRDSLYSYRKGYLESPYSSEEYRVFDRITQSYID